MSLIYLEYAPRPRLSDFVACYWFLETAESENSSTYRVLPDGCVDLIFDNGASADGIFVGGMTKAVAVSLPPRARFFGVRFRPGGARPFVNFSLKEIIDAKANLADVWRNCDAEFSDVMRNADAKRQINAVEKFLIEKLASAEFPNSKIQAAVALIHSRNGNCSINSVSEKLGTSRQHLNRIFGEAVGLSPKTFTRIVRLRAALRLFRRSPVKDWAFLALESGYYDQAH